jgi:hypothetical protein
LSRGHDLPVGLNRHPVGKIVTRGEIGNELAVTAEGGIEITGRSESDITLSRDESESGDNDHKRRPKQTRH